MYRLHLTICTFLNIYHRLNVVSCPVSFFATALCDLDWHSLHHAKLDALELHRRALYSPVDRTNTLWSLDTQRGRRWTSRSRFVL